MSRDGLKSKNFFLPIEEQTHAKNDSAVDVNKSVDELNSIIERLFSKNRLCKKQRKCENIVGPLYVDPDIFVKKQHPKKCRIIPKVEQRADIFFFNFNKIYFSFGESKTLQQSIQRKMWFMEPFKNRRISESIK